MVVTHQLQLPLTLAYLWPTCTLCVSSIGVIMGMEQLIMNLLCFSAIILADALRLRVRLRCVWGR